MLIKCYILKNKYAKTGKGLLLFLEEGATVDGDCYLKMLKKHLYVIKRLSCGQKVTIQQYRVRCLTANSVTNYHHENVPDLSDRKIDLLILVTSIYVIMQFET